MLLFKEIYNFSQQEKIWLLCDAQGHFITDRNCQGSHHKSYDHWPKHTSTWLLPPEAERAFITGFLSTSSDKTHRPWTVRTSCLLVSDKDL